MTHRANGRGLKRPSVLVTNAAIHRSMKALSKAHLMDLAWSLAGRISVSADDPDAVYGVLLNESRVVAEYRGDKPLEDRQP